MECLQLGEALLDDSGNVAVNIRGTIPVEDVPNVLEVVLDQAVIEDRIIGGIDTLSITISAIKPLKVPVLASTRAQILPVTERADSKGIVSFLNTLANDPTRNFLRYEVDLSGAPYYLKNPRNYVQLSQVFSVVIQRFFASAYAEEVSLKRRNGQVLISILNSQEIALLKQTETHVHSLQLACDTFVYFNLSQTTDPEEVIARIDQVAGQLGSFEFYEL